MAYSTLTIRLVPNSSTNTTTLTLQSSSLVEARSYIQNLTHGLFDDTGVFFPLANVISITIS